MEITQQFPLFLAFILFSLSIPAQFAANSCKPASCNNILGPTVRFPFWIRGRQPARCGYTGFSLNCNTRNQTTINLHESGVFVVNYINYSSQSLSIRDPDSCLPNRILNFSLSGSPFRAAYSRNYTFLNCSFWDDSNYTESFPYDYVGCLSGENYTVAVASLDFPGNFTAPAGCRRIGNVSVPAKWRGPDEYWPTVEVIAHVDLVWSNPSCSECENQGRVCGFVSAGSKLEVGCYSDKHSGSSGLPRSAKYGIIIGVGIPGLVCIIGLICYICGLIKVHFLGHRLDPEIPVTTVSNEQSNMATAIGLDEPTIESYPKTVLGESCRLPNPNDGTCPICLCEYRPKDTLRSIPECNHYFHAGCVDEWLRLNGTCPLCRNSPDGSIATPCSSLSLSSPSLSSTSDNR